MSSDIPSPYLLPWVLSCEWEHYYVWNLYSLRIAVIHWEIFPFGLERIKEASVKKFQVHTISGSGVHRGRGLFIFEKLMQHYYLYFSEKEINWAFSESIMLNNFHLISIKLAQDIELYVMFVMSLHNTAHSDVLKKFFLTSRNEICFYENDRNENSLLVFFVSIFFFYS